MINTLLITAAFLLQTAPAAQVSGTDLAADVATLAAAASNEARFEALTAMLTARKIAFTTEPVTLEKPLGREPRTSGRNVIVTLGQGEKTIVVGAHYDASRLADGSLSKGAVDNAASSVMLVRLAAALTADPPPARVRIIWFDMEELGLIGSSQYVAAHKGDLPAAMINFDINAYGDTVLFGPSQRPESTELRRMLRQTCAGMDLECIGFAQMPPSDDRSFVRAGVPTVSVALLPALEAHQLWLLVNGGPKAGLAAGTAPAIMTTIHTPEDLPARVDGESMARVLRFAQALVRSVAGK